MSTPLEKPKNDINDDELIQAINGGREDLFYELVKRYQQSLYNFGRRMCDNPSDAEELGEVIRQALVDLHEKYRLVVVLRDVEGFSTQETD